MRSAEIRAAFEVTVLLSTAAALAIGAWTATRSSEAPRAPSAPGASTPAGALVTGLFLHPLGQLALVCVALYVNQVLFGAFILRAHGGSAAFIARYIPGGWFAIGTRDPLVAFAARHVGDGAWLSPTLLRVQAFLELPFTMLAYLAVARLLGRRLYATLAGLPVLLLVALSFSVTFSLVELSLPNPYTNDDLALRAVSCVATPVVLAWVARVEARRDPRDAAGGPSGVLGLLAFVAGAGAVAYVVLALYDAFLLYNLAHLPRYAAGLAASLVIAVAASFAAPRIDTAVARATGARASGGRSGVARASSPAVDVCVSSLRAFTLLFFVPSLSLRYSGLRPGAVACGLVVVGLAVVAGVGGVLARARLGVVGLLRLAAAGVVALLAGGFAAQLALAGPRPPMPELLLARASLSFLVVAIVAFRTAEIALCWRAHETKAAADEA
jgi:hypothetical protein